MHTHLPLALAAGLLLAAPSALAAKTIVTPALPPTNAGSLQCWVINASETKTIEVEIEIRSFTGTVDESGSASIAPGGSNVLGSMVDVSRYCFVRVTRGSAKSLRVSLVAIEGGVPVAVVDGR